MTTMLLSTGANAGAAKRRLAFSRAVNRVSRPYSSTWGMNMISSGTAMEICSSAATRSPLKIV